ncbi:MAG TPA: DUF362 domain-containing protein [Anaerolineales bacterium]|nr:DUF362 domain-containing protein [Anaerolineales bacterium]
MPHTPLSRREFLHVAGAVGATAALTQACRFASLSDDASLAPTATGGETMPTSTPFSPQPTPTVVAPAPTPEPLVGRVALVRTTDRGDGVRRAVDLLGVRTSPGAEVFVKPNFNSADPTPGSTHSDVLQATIERLREWKADRITVGDRSGMGDTRAVMQSLGIFDMAGALDFETLVFDDLSVDDWVALDAPGSHWRQGFHVARPCLDAQLVQLCCLKTHRFGGHFTLSLKNSVGMVAKRVPGDGYDYMTELHLSSNQRRMIAEINAAYAPVLVVMDGVEAFTSGGPDSGKRVSPEVVMASADRVALDAAGVAILRDFGTTNQVARGRVFEQAQIARAVELGLGVDSPQGIQFVTGDDESRSYAERLQEILLAA